ncbi:MAG: rod shape-determining protein MreD [Fibromonadaceae bacterium]|nr:rod shape-determining protein MreD [Fibromonadaceae bacterium]
MLKFLVYAFLFFIAALFQTVIASRIEILGVQPSFLIILTVMVAFRYGGLAGCVMGFVSGLFCDVYAPTEWLGAFSLAYCTVGFVVGQINESFIDLNLFLQVVVLALVNFLKDIIYYFSVGKAVSDVPKMVFSFTLPNTLYTVIIGVACLYLFSLTMGRKTEIYK